MVPFRFHKAGVKVRQLAVDIREGGGEDLKPLAPASFDKRTANQMIDHLIAGAIANRPHQAGDPGAWARRGKTNAATLQNTQDQLEMLQLLDGDGVEFIHALE